MDCTQYTTKLKMITNLHGMQCMCVNPSNKQQPLYSKHLPSSFEPQLDFASYCPYDTYIRR